MVELVAQDPFAGALPVTIGTVTVTAVHPGAVTSLSLSDPEALGKALEAAHGLALPKPGRSSGGNQSRCLWFGRDHVLLVGPTPDASLGQHAAVVDQSDAWVWVTLHGADVCDVLARLVPIDLRAATFKRGHSARTQVQHINASITRTGPDSFLIAVFRSMAGTLVHDLTAALEAVAARG